MNTCYEYMYEYISLPIEIRCKEMKTHSQMCTIVSHSYLERLGTSVEYGHE